MTELSLERFAELLALSKHFAPNGDEALLRSGIEPEAFRSAESFHFAALVSGVMLEETAALQTFGLRFSLERARLRALAPTLDSLGPLPVANLPADELAPPRRPTAAGTSALVPPASVAMSPDAAAASDGAPILPTYLAKLAQQPEGVDVEETLPIWGTPAPKPATPFSGATTPERLAALKALRARSEPEPSEVVGDETLMVRSPLLAEADASAGFAERLTPTAIPTLSVDEYARFRALLGVRGEDHQPTWKEFGILSRAAKEMLQSRFANYFQRDPAAQRHFLELVEQHTRKHGQPG